MELRTLRLIIGYFAVNSTMTFHMRMRCKLASREHVAVSEEIAGKLLQAGCLSQRKVSRHEELLTTN